MAAWVSFVLGPFEENILTGDQQGLRLYIQATKDIDKESDKIDITVDNYKDIIDHFLSLANKYDWGRLAFMAQNGSDKRNIFWKVDQKNIADIHVQSFGYFALQGIGNINQVLPNPLEVQVLLNIATTPQGFFYN